jgi:hypothetical protein
MELCFDTDFTLFAPRSGIGLLASLKESLQSLLISSPLRAALMQALRNCKLNIAAAGFECWE